MDVVPRRGEAVPVPRSPREIVGSAVAPRWRRIARGADSFAERQTAPLRELPPEWFRYPLP
jgi:hypothetical protein